MKMKWLFHIYHYCDKMWENIYQHMKNGGERVMFDRGIKKDKCYIRVDNVDRWLASFMRYCINS